MPRDETHELLVPDGTPLKVAVSALIKTLRRGQEVEALYWARQIEARYGKYVWRRLRIFASEDVGLGDPHAAVLVASLADTYRVLADERQKKTHPIDRSPLTHAVLYLARAEKSREVDDLLNVLDHLSCWGWMPTLRDEVFDLHTPEGRDRLPRSQRFRHWAEEASRVVPRVGPYDWRLWMLRWATQRGLYPVAWVERLAARWETAGRLRYGLEGYEATRFDWRTVDPEFPDEVFDEPEDDERWR